MSRILFILKRKTNFYAKQDDHIGVSTGLYNSAKFMDDMLQENGVESKLVVVQDNNSIDREVTQYRPTHVIIEALWVVPEKFTILQKLHPNVKWVIRVHSEMPFMAGEGPAMDWLGEYSKFKNVIISCNAPRMQDEVEFYLKTANGWTDEQLNDKMVYLPNYYPVGYKIKPYINKDTIDIGCFGAVRPLKNHLLQAYAALKFAEDNGKTLNFHINSARLEMNGGPVLNNLIGLFQHLYDRGHRLVNHEWTPRDEFIKLCGQMDIGMQCSFSETFNIVAADFISQGVPVIGSMEIPWLHECLIAEPSSSNNMAYALSIAHNNPQENVKIHQDLLKEYCINTRLRWLNYFKE
jgi:hypothetical protein